MLIFLIYVIGLWIVSEVSTLVMIRQNQYSLILNLERKTLKLKYVDIQQHSVVKYLRGLIDVTMTGEAIKLIVIDKIKLIDKINNKLKFLYCKLDFFTLALRLILFNTLIQSHFDYA